MTGPAVSFLPRPDGLSGPVTTAEILCLESARACNGVQANSGVPINVTFMKLSTGEKAFFQADLAKRLSLRSIRALLSDEK